MPPTQRFADVLRTFTNSSDRHTLARSRRPRRADPPVAMVAIALLALFSCGESTANEPAPEPSVTVAERAAAREQLVALTELYGIVDPLLLSDKKDALMAERESLRKKLRSAGLATALEAEAMFHEWPARDEFARSVLLEVAAHGRPAALSDSLIDIVRLYDPELGLFVRTEAARILAETSPEAAVQLFRELLSSPPNATLPPAEVLLRRFGEATAAIGQPDAPLLADIVTDFQRAPDLRYAAITLLGGIDDPRSRQALEVVLVESGSDGYVRRKAAQALANLLPPDELCPILLRVADRETSEAFLLFLANQIELLCP